jgi:hypothetical protein
MHCEESQSEQVEHDQGQHRKQCATARKTDERDMNAQHCTLQNVTVAAIFPRAKFLRTTAEFSWQQQTFSSIWRTLRGHEPLGRVSFSIPASRCWYEESRFI